MHRKEILHTMGTVSIPVNPLQLLKTAKYG